MTERARIAREMHDVVSHNIQVMVTLADAASLAQATDPARAAEAMHEVSSTGRQALTDMRRMLGVLRDEPVPAGPDDSAAGNGSAVSNAAAGNGSGHPPLAPQPDLRELPALVERVRGTGLDVSVRRVGVPFDVSGAAGPDGLPGGAGGPDQRAEARRGGDVGGGGAGLQRPRRRRAGHRRRPEHRSLSRPERSSGGHGLAGMAERADAFGGTLSAGPTPRRRLGGRGQAARLQGPRAGMTIRVVLADDQALLRKGFRMILEAEEDMEIVGEAADGADAVRLVELYRPDVVLMDVRMPVLDGIEATRAITSSEAGDEHPRPDPHDLRPGRVRLQRAAGGRQRVPPQGRPPGGARERHPHRRPR